MGEMLQAGSNFWNRWSGVLGAGVLAALTIYFLGGRFTTVRFDRERIDVEVEEGLIHVHGLYHYQSTSRLPTLLTLATPFPVDADHPAPEACESQLGGFVSHARLAGFRPPDERLPGQA